MSADRQGDPSSALLEVLDPEQNTAFHDNFLDVDYDLSKVMFIATANNLNTIPGPLLDRMELIEVSGYITEEKVEIARKHLVPKELEANGMKKTDIKIPKDTLEAIIESYTPPNDIRIYFRFKAAAIDFPSEVLPTPGGPYKQIIGDFMSPFNLSTAKCSRMRSFTFSRP